MRWCRVEVCEKWGMGLDDKRSKTLRGGFRINTNRCTDFFLQGEPVIPYYPGIEEWHHRVESNRVLTDWLTD